jgi:hypothetical protein
MFASESFLTLANVTFFANEAEGPGVGEGGGIGMVAGSAQLTDVVFEMNAANFVGGGFSNRGGSVVLKNVEFLENIATIGAGGMLNEQSDAELSNVVFRDNIAVDLGGGGMVNFMQSHPVLTNVTFAGNKVVTALGAGGAILNTEMSSVTLVNSILWGNVAGTSNFGNEIYLQSDSSASLDHSIHANGNGDIQIEPGATFTCADCVTDDPLFRDAANGDLRLDEASPAIDTGDPITDLALFPGGPGNPVDIEGNPRVFGNRIDIGAYEWQQPDEIFRDGFEQ